MNVFSRSQRRFRMSLRSRIIWLYRLETACFHQRMLQIKAIKLFVLNAPYVSAEDRMYFPRYVLFLARSRHHIYLYNGMNLLELRNPPISLKQTWRSRRRKNRVLRMMVFSIRSSSRLAASRYSRGSRCDPVEEEQLDTLRVHGSAVDCRSIVG